MLFIRDIKVFLKGNARNAFLMLQGSNEKQAKSILRSVERIIEILKQNPQYGDPIKKERIPASLKKLGIQNLYRAELSNYWRFLYTIEGTKEGLFIFVLEILSHKDYNQLFGYKG